MALATYACPSEGCKAQMGALRGSTVGHVCPWAKSKYVNWVMISPEFSRAKK